MSMYLDLERYIQYVVIFLIGYPLILELIPVTSHQYQERPECHITMSGNGAKRGLEIFHDLKIRKGALDGSHKLDSVATKPPAILIPSGLVTPNIEAVEIAVVAPEFDIADYLVVPQIVTSHLHLR